MEITHLATELTPIAKVGGLADVLQGLSHALISKGHQVEIILPKYDTLELPFDHIQSYDTFSVWQGEMDTIKIIAIESHAGLFNQGGVYGCKNDTERFTFFCKASLDYLNERKKHPDIIHLHDWHTALAAPLLKERYLKIKARCIFTIHNLTYQGHCEEKILDQIGWKTAAIREGDHYNLMKAGIIYADHVTTVSPTYAKEILTTDKGNPFRPLLEKRGSTFSGVLNGIDYTYWDPNTDIYLPAHFSYDQPDNKKIIQNKLREKLSLEKRSCPLVAAITRLVYQKGPELIKAGLLHTLKKGGQCVLLGSAPDQAVYQQFKQLKKMFEDSSQIHIELTYNEELSHLVYGASDLFLLPSIFEPCGLAQLIAMRYGALPVVRQTGGLADTVFDEENGFCFNNPQESEICHTLNRAFALWNTPKWEQMKKNGMKGDYSWNQPAARYLEIYTV